MAASKLAMVISTQLTQTWSTDGSLEKGRKGFQRDEENWETDLEVDGVAS